jgi:TonB family protein
MQEKDKNGTDQLSDFIRYHGNKMTDRERNAFERSLQKDTFTEEASEGYNKTDGLLAEKDISELRKRLNKRTSAHKKILRYRIAVSVAVLMILTSVFIIEERRKPSENIAQTPESPAVKETPVLQELKQRPEAAGIKDQAPAVSDKSKKVLHEIQKSEGISEKSILIGGKVISSEDNQPIPGASITVKGTNKSTITNTDGYFSVDTKEAADSILVAYFIGMESKEFKAVEDTGLEIKLDPSVSAMSETIVVGYGVKGAGEEQEDVMKGYTPPRPVKGKAAFDKYIRDHIRRPDSITAGQRVVVVLGFIVEENGKIDSISIVRSPGKLFSDEAIRLIREGPAWKPADKNGESISDEVRIRIVFK